MTIKEAIERFEKEGEEHSAPALREVINDMIDRNIKTEFENDCYTDALTLTSLMFNRSTSSIRMLTGPQGDGFLMVLKKSFLGSLDRIRANKGEVRIVMLGKPNEYLEGLMKQYPDTLKIFAAKTASPIKHFTVCDTKMARMEEFHGELTPETDATNIKARVCFNDSVKGRVLEESFDSIWKWLNQFAQTKAKTPLASEAVHTN